ncbi:MAG: SulP family inorganic anion transporter [Anaerolineae bacterium]|nr:SulP family inorganic anion transporter [Anaerolineae bacterium]
MTETKPAEACDIDAPASQHDRSPASRNHTLDDFGKQSRDWFRFLGRLLIRPVGIFKAYQIANLRPDLIAGLTVAVVALPQAMAYALIAELPPETGLYATIVGAVIGTLWGSSHHLQTGATNTASLLVLSALLAVATPGTPDYLVTAGVMAVLIGIFKIIMAFARLGVIVNFVSDAVVTGFTAGAGILIGINQLRHLLRLPIPSYPNLWGTIPAVLDTIPQTHITSLLIGAGTIIIIIVLPKISNKLPAPLLAMITAAALVGIMGLDTHGVKVVGQLPRGLPPLVKLPVFNLQLVSKLIGGSLAVAAIGLIEPISIGRSISTRSGQRLDSNQEFFGQGLANIFSGFFSGYAVSGSFTRSAINYEAGAETGISSLFSSLFVLLSMILFAPYAAYVPQAALAGVLMVTAYSLVDTKEIAHIWSSSVNDRIIMAISFVATLVLPLEHAVLTGIAYSLFAYLRRTSEPRVRVVLPSDDFRYFTPRPTMPSCHQLGVMEILGDLYFGAVSHIEEKIQENLSSNPAQRYLLLRMYTVENCDISGIHTLESIVKLYHERGGDVFFVHVQRQIRELMESSGFADMVGADHFLDPDEAINFLFYKVINPAICIYECPVKVFEYCQNLPKRLDLACPDTTWVGSDSNVPHISPNDLWQQMHTMHPPTIIDVREPREYKNGHIPNVIRSDFADILEKGLENIPRDRKVVVVCQGGRRSWWVARRLGELGYAHVSVLEGGMLSWEHHQLLQAVELTQ